MKKIFRVSIYDQMPKPVHRDNKEVHNTKNNYSSGSYNPIRVPSLKRNKKTWRNFYNLFPKLKGLKKYGSIKLRPWKEVS